MRRSIAPMLVSCAAVCAAAALVLPGAAALDPVARGAAVALLAAATVAAWSAWRRADSTLAAERNARTACEQRYDALFEARGDIVCTFELSADDRPGRLIAVNEAACMSLGYPRPELLGMTWGELYAPEVRRSVAQRMLALDQAESLAFESSWLTSDGHRLPVEVSLRRAGARPSGVCLVVARDQSARRELAQASRDRAHADELTGLLTRGAFFAAVGNARQRARRLSAQVLVLHAELTGLKGVNDRLGHAAADALVLAAVDVLHFTFRDSDVVARLGGAEFVALAVLGRSDRERVDWRAIVARFDQAVLAKRAELAGEFVFDLRYAVEVADWEDLDDIDVLLSRTRQPAPLPGAWAAVRRVEKLAARV
jgi:diguanylate cyclase (GGDEF)-like protein/PAS domain S-box-containing protein